MSDTPANEPSANDPLAIDALGSDARAWDDNHQQMLSFIGALATQLSELAKTVEDEELQEKLSDLADQCSGEYFGFILRHSGCQTTQTEKD